VVVQFSRYRVPTKPCNRKHASNVVTGRSFAAKRAIARRSANCNTSHHKTGLGTVTFTVGAFQIEDLRGIGENPYLLDNASSLSLPNGFAIGSSCNFIKIRDYTIKQKAIVSYPMPTYEITANYDLIYNTIVINSDATNKLSTKIQKLNNIISKPAYWTLVPKSNVTVNQTSIIATPPGSVAGESSLTGFSFTITPDNNVSTNCCCLLPTVTYSGPRNAYRMPCSGGLTRRTLLQPCTNPTVKK